MRGLSGNRRNCLVMVVGLLLLFMSIPSFATNDTISDGFKNNLIANLNALSELDLWDTTDSEFGKAGRSKIDNPELVLKDLNLSGFNQYTPLTSKALLFLEGLDETQKQNLLRSYFYYKTEFLHVFETLKLPAELIFFAPALSAMNPSANGQNKRAGIWQLDHFQAVLGGLQIDKLIDERYCALPATKVFASQIKQNLEQFNDLELAIAAYLHGHAKVNNTLYAAKVEEKPVNLLLPDFYKETIAMYQAMAIFLSENLRNKQEQNLEGTLAFDTIKTEEQLHLTQISTVLNIPEKELQNLNPQYKFSIVPGGMEQNEIILPAGKKDEFILQKDSIYAAEDSTLFQLVTQKIEYPPAPNRQYTGEPVKNLEIEGKTKIKYRLKSGDILGFIAERYDVRVADLKYWNNIYNERRIQAGKYLDIFIDDDKVDYYKGLDPSSTGTSGKSVVAVAKKKVDLTNARKIEHIVKSGESPYVIAKKYSGVSPDEILEWNNIRDARKIQIGQKLIVYVKE